MIATCTRSYLIKPSYAVLLLLRTYALYNLNPRVLYSLLCIGLATVGVAAVSHTYIRRILLDTHSSCGGIETQWAILSERGSTSLETPDISQYIGCDLRVSERECVVHSAP